MSRIAATYSDAVSAVGAAIAGWAVDDLLSPSLSANSYGLHQNCYYCTAAALQGLTCDELITRTETMQQDTGSIPDFAGLMADRIFVIELTHLQDVKNLLLAKLPMHTAVGFGYERLNGTGHMIVVFKARFLVNDHTGKVTDSKASGTWGNLRHIDYQSQHPRPHDSLLPENEPVSGIKKCFVLCKAG